MNRQRIPSCLLRCLTGPPQLGFAFSLILAGLLAVTLSLPGRAAPGKHGNAILLGQSCALTGPAGELGQNFRSGLLASFEAYNRSTGLSVRSIELISLDDRYEPELAIRNTRRLIANPEVFCLIGEVGTPTSKAVLPIIEEASVPFIAPFTGAELLRQPFKPQVFNIRSSYAQELECLVGYLTEALNIQHIACLYQNDAFGQNGLWGLKRALAKRDMQLVSTGHYERNTVAVKNAFLSIRSGQPEAVVLIGAYRPCASFISLARRHGLESATFCTISFVGAESLQKTLQGTENGCIVSQVVPSPWQSRLPVIQEYRRDLERHQPGRDYGYVSLEGYLAGRFFIQAVQAIPGPLTRQGLIRTIEKRQTFDLGGLVLRFGPHDHQGLDRVYLSIIKDCCVQPLSSDPSLPPAPP